MQTKSRTIHTAALPLLLAGIPPAVENWLQLSGIPTTPWTNEIYNASTQSEIAVPLLLFDSRNAKSQSDARDAKTRGLKTLDIASVDRNIDSDETELVEHSTDLPSYKLRLQRARFLDRLKKRIESAGGLWMRMADFPHPYQSACITGHRPANTEIEQFQNAFDFPPVTGGEQNSQGLLGGKLQKNLAAWIRGRCTAGLPFQTTETMDDGPNQTRIGEIDPEEFPFLWQTTWAEFLQWWHEREQLHFEVRKEGPNYDIIATATQCNGFCPALELWRGNHVAAFPLTNSEMSLRDEGLVFALEYQKHPAGFAPLSYIDQPEKGPVEKDIPQPA